MSEERGGWVYESFRWYEGDGDAATWREELLAAGWQESEYGVGAWSVIDGQRVFVMVFKRWSERPNAAPPP
ncbi:hypothetical protein [Phycicoccus avicenniae]|uniref:hypothetical protein n=1 Tax=Phycicoccus avicenniae TaxID=2828860 RepID=UPI003D2B34F0